MGYMHENREEGREWFFQESICSSVVFSGWSSEDVLAPMTTPRMLA